MIHNNKSIIIEFVVVLLLCYALSSNINVLPAGPDAKLYHGLSSNIFSEVGFVDNIRNDFILPSIGHPLLIGVFQKLGITDGIFVSKILLFLSLFSCYLLTMFLGFKTYIRLIAILLTYAILPDILMWGIELSLMLSGILLWLGILKIKTEKTTKTAIFLGLAILFNLLIRPVLSPLFYLSLILVIISFFINRESTLKILIAFAISGIVFFGVRGYSVLKHKDSRMVTGTYSEIPLYCANNKYIPIDIPYNSHRWKAVPDSLYQEAISPLNLKTTWQDRSKELKEKVKHFIFNNPKDALKGYLWRLKKYTISQDSRYGTIIFFGWLILFVFFIRKYKELNLFKLTITGIPIYIIAVLSLFPYTGVRYLLPPSLYFLCSLLIMISYLDKSNWVTVHRPDF